MLVFTAGVAQAGIITFQPQWQDASALNLGNSGWSFDTEVPYWAVVEEYVAPGSDTVALGASGTTDSDPSLHISKTITNNSTFVWTDYHIVISGQGVSYVSGSASSDKFGTIVEGVNSIDFYAPQLVPIGQSVTVAFDVQIPEGMFSFGIDQTPTPEPATLGMLAMGGLALIRRKRL